MFFKTGEARAFYNLGNIYQSKGKHMGRLLCNRDPSEFPQEVKDVLTHAIDYYRKTLDLVHNKDRAAEGRTYGNLGNTYYLLGEFELAIECHSEVNDFLRRKIEERFNFFFLFYKRGLK